MREVLDQVENVSVFTDWVGFGRGAVRARCAVAVVEWLNEPVALWHLGAFKHRLPDTPLVLATTRDAGNARFLKDIRADDVVWLSELKRQLGLAIRRACEVRYLRRVASAVEQADEIPRVLRVAMSLLCRTEGQMPCQAEVACLIGVDRTRLWQEWHGLMPTGLRFKSFFDWVLLLRAVAAKTPCQNWGSVAADLGVHEHTISRTAVRLTGLHLSRMDGGLHARLAAQFEQEILKFIGIVMNDND